MTHAKTTPILTIHNLCANIAGQPILNGINLTIYPNEIHAIMGPNGSGKSTLGNILAGKDDYTITDGEIIFLGENLLELPIHERAQRGLFLGFQYPVEIPGVSTINLIKAAINARRQWQGLPPYDAMDFLQIIREHLPLVQLDEDFIYRSVNTGFSGGEKKRAEILQMALLSPALAVLDEIDSGLDIDALKAIAQTINQTRTTEQSYLLITHYQRLLDYITPDYIHVLIDGEIVKSGDKSLANELEAKGYSWLHAANEV